VIGFLVLLRVGFELTYDCAQPTPMIVHLNVHASRVADLVTPDRLIAAPAVPLSGYHDSFGNWCTRLVAPAGGIRLTSDALVRVSGLPDAQAPQAEQHAVEDLPAATLTYLLGSRYCETDRLSDVAWALFGNIPPGWPRAQAVCAFVHQHIVFGYQHARSTRSAWEGYQERVGVCRDYAHLALTFCRCLNIPARYCTGYLGDIGVPPDGMPMDFSGWFEVFLGGRWYTMDARHNRPRIGRVPIAYGRDASDVAISNTFGPNTLTGFRVWTDEVPEPDAAPPPAPRARIADPVPAEKYAK
jgi:transglutaminase-like putative cysteine protease